MNILGVLRACNSFWQDNGNRYKKNHILFIYTQVTKTMRIFDFVVITIKLCTLHNMNILLLCASHYYNIHQLLSTTRVVFVLE